MILVDTGPLVAFFDASDRYHGTCLDLLREMDEKLCTTWPVITECFFLLDYSWKAQDNLWQFLVRGGLEIMSPEPDGFERCRWLMHKYRDLPMDLADASLVVLAEAKKIRHVFTLDHKDFSLYRPSHVGRFDLIPAQL